TDDNNCQESARVIISSLDDVPPVVFVNDVNLFLGDDGTVSLSLGQVNNGSFDNCGIASMSLSQDEFDCTHVGSNTVTLTVTDQAGNSAEETLQVMISDLIAPEMTCPEDIVVPACEAALDYPMPIVNDNCADVIDPVLTSGLPPGATFPEGLTVVSYSFTDGGNNSAICSFEVTVKPALAVEETVTHVTCNGDTDGAISVVASSGTPDYTFTWADGFSGTDVANLAAGIYNLTVTDADNCDEVLNIEVLQPDPVNFEINLLVNETEGFSNGLIDITPTGGTAPYSFKWTLNGEFFAETGDISGLAAGEYAVQIVDANNCSFQSDPIIIENLTGTEDILVDAGFEIMPNPTSGMIRITFDEPLDGEGLISVWDILGQKVLEGVELIQGTQEVPLDCTGFSNGTYFVRLDTDGGIFLRKMIVNR
ncbi:MAG: HYR domain-containing protein, partial [Bacteroidetes bacterium]